MRLDDFIEILMRGFRERSSAVIAFSGGVDSSVVTAMAHMALRDRALAVTIDSPLSPPGEVNDARKVANAIGVRHMAIRLNELEIPGFSDNPTDRCYLCKKLRIRMLKDIARELGFNVVADGTSKSDMGERRPGLRASIEEGVYMPLLEAGLTKDEVRCIARSLGLPSWDRPSNPCLATRIPYGMRITHGRLRRIAVAETAIKEALGIRVLRVRNHGDIARIEVGRDERELLFSGEILDWISSKLKGLGFKFVTLDLEGYREGSLDVYEGDVEND